MQVPRISVILGEKLIIILCTISVFVSVAKYLQETPWVYGY